MIIINKLEIENGKYQIENNNGIVKVYRYGELWLDGVTKFELCLIQRIEELEQQNKRYREAINSIIEKVMLLGTNEEVYEAIQDAIKVLEEKE